MLKDSLRRDHLVAGVHNTTVWNKLLQTSDLLLTKCVIICELSEFNIKQLEAKVDHSTTQEVYYIRTTDNGCTPTPNALTRPSVWRGGASQTTATNNYSKQCQNCRYDHFAKVCCNKPQTSHDVRAEESETNNQERNNQTSEIDELMADRFVGEIKAAIHKAPDLWFAMGMGVQ